MSCQSHLRGHKVHITVLVFFKIEKVSRRLNTFILNFHCIYVRQESTCIILLFIANTENRLHPAVRFADTVAAAHVPTDGNQQGNISISEGC